MFASMELQQETPLATVREIRDAETEQSLQPVRIVVSAPRQQPSATDIRRYDICGVIRSRCMR